VKTILVLACLLIANVCSGECVKNARGKTVCTNGEQAVAVNPNAGTVTTAQKNPIGATSAQSATGNTAAAVNHRTGNAAVAHTNPNGVTTTQTSMGGQAKTKNGKGVYEAPNGTKCAKTAHNNGCTK
jgi:hypothetical protein